MTSTRVSPLVVVLLALGLIVRAGTFALPHREGDERIYAALLEQVKAGKGYTLAGHPILAQDWMVAEQYDGPLFYHPPGGLAWFALFVAPFGARGWEIAQLAAFALFFGATVALARDALPSQGAAARATVAVLAAFTPIVAHVSMHRWLDGPQVAAAALAAWLMLRATRTGSAAMAIAAGAAVGCALLVKLNAAVAAPGLAALAWAATPAAPRRVKLRALAIAFGVALVLVAPWLLAELRAYGTVFPAWAGRPSPRLVAENPFIRQVTAVRAPWDYLRLLPQTVWTIVPALAILAVTRPARESRRIAAALVAWIAIVVGVNMALGALGYSKLLRYVVLAAPATVLLAGLAAGEVARALATSRPGSWRRWAVVGLASALVLGVALEAAQGVQTMRRYPDRAWIRPLLGEPR